jgi:protocatechuate 4,5-dioxygenase, alpha chain
MEADLILDPPGFDLEAPGSYVYDGRRAALGRRINAFAQGLKAASNRAAFKADPQAYLDRSDLTDEERGHIAARDYSWLVDHGGHIQCVQRIAAIDGHYLFHVAAHVIGVDVDDLVAVCPRHVSCLGGMNG